jgi:hypothetical protein
MFALWLNEACAALRELYPCFAMTHVLQQCCIFMDDSYENCAVWKERVGRN